MSQPLRRFKAEFFKALAHPARITMLEALREGEKTVADLQALLHDEPASASQHLSVLRHRNVVTARKAGTTVYYSAKDPLLFDLLDTGRAIFNKQLSDAHAMLGVLENERPAVRVPSARRGNNRRPR